MKALCFVLAFVLPASMLGCGPEDASALQARFCPDTPAAKIGALVASQTMIRDRLRAPASAVFPLITDRGVSVRYVAPCIFDVEAYVESQNALGVALRAHYRVRTEYDAAAARHRGELVIFE